jgi:hypothetical protein
VTKTVTNQIQANGIANVPLITWFPGRDGDFGVATLNKYTATKDIVLGNVGRVGVTGCGAPTLADTTHFSIVSHDCTSTLAAGAYCTAHVRAKPVSAGYQTTTLSMVCTEDYANQNLQVAAWNTTLPTQFSMGHPAIYRMSDGQVRYSSFGEIYPQTTNAFTDAVQVTTGGSYYCVVRSGGTIQCYGANSVGQLGDGTTTDAFGAPVTVSGITNAISVAASDNGQHTCAVLSTGTVKCWGYNGDGQLGDGTTTNRSSPVSVSGITTATAVTVGIQHSCALLTGGTMKCWGANNIRSFRGDRDIRRQGPSYVRGPEFR